MNPISFLVQTSVVLVFFQKSIQSQKMNKLKDML